MMQAVEDWFPVQIYFIVPPIEMQPKPGSPLLDPQAPALPHWGKQASTELPTLVVQAGRPLTREEEEG